MPPSTALHHPLQATKLIFNPRDFCLILILTYVSSFLKSFPFMLTWNSLAQQIGVTNPNFFGASFSKISAKAYYPLNKTAALGGGELENVDIKPHSNTTINFPFQINYTTSLDPNRAILADIASRCGFLNNPKNKSFLPCILAARFYIYFQQDLSSFLLLSRMFYVPSRSHLILLWSWKY